MGHPNRHEDRAESSGHDRRIAKPRAQPAMPGLDMDATPRFSRCAAAVVARTSVWRITVCVYLFAFAHARARWGGLRPLSMHLAISTRRGNLDLTGTWPASISENRRN